MLGWYGSYGSQLRQSLALTHICCYLHQCPQGQRTMQMPSYCRCCGVNHNRTYQACLNLTGVVSVQVKTDYQHAVKEGIVDLGFQNPSKAAQLTAHHIDQVKVVHPIPEQGCINLDNACGQSGRVVAGVQVGCQGRSVFMCFLGMAIRASQHLCQKHTLPPMSLPPQDNTTTQLSRV